VSTTPTASNRRTVARSARKRAVKPRVVQAKIVRLVPRRLLERVVRGQAGESGGGCHKCGSLFVEIEPAFIHCRYCGSLSRIHGASLLAQEEWEQRSGMRLAS
jgi:hypothetical protein